MNSLPASEQPQSSRRVAHELRYHGISPVALRAGGVRWKVRSAALAADIQDLLREPDAWLLDKDRLIHDTFLVTMGRVVWPALNGDRWLLRRTNYGKPMAKFRDFFRVSGPMRAFKNGLAFEQAGLPVPRVLAAGIIRVLHKPVVGYLLMEEIVSVASLREHARRHRSFSPAAVEQTAKAVARMHEQGFAHGDLTINNVLLDERLQPWLVDLERAKFLGRPVNWRATVDDFYRFARYINKLGPGGRFASLRLLTHYCRLRGWAGREREFAIAVMARLRERVKDDAQA